MTIHIKNYFQSSVTVWFNSNNYFKKFSKKKNALQVFAVLYYIITLFIVPCGL